MRRRSKPDPERLILNLRIADLNKLFAHRYGGDRATYVFPDDDDGRENLDILIKHTRRSIRMLRRGSSSCGHRG